MFINSIVHIMGGIGSRFIIFFINITVAVTFSIGEASEYALVLGWANALAALSFNPLGNLFRKLQIESKPSYISSYFFGVVILTLIVVAVFSFFSDIVLPTSTLSKQLLLPLTISLSLVYFTSYVVVENNKLLAYNFLLIIGYITLLVLFQLFKLVVWDILAIYSFINILISLFFLRFRLSVSNLFEFKSVINNNLRYLSLLFFQTALGLPVFMGLQSYIKEQEYGDIAVVSIFAYLQIFNIVNIIIQKVNQVIVPRLLTMRGVKGRLLITYFSFLVFIILALNLIIHITGGDLYIIDLSGFSEGFIIFSFFYFINSASWVVLDYANAKGKEELVTKTTILSIVLVVMSFALYKLLNVNLLTAYAAAVGLPRLIQILILYKSLGNKDEGSCNSIIR